MKTNQKLKAVPQPKYLDNDALEALAVKITRNGDEGDTKAAAFLILIDEIEKAQFDRLQIDNICFVVKKAAFANSDMAYNAMQETIGRLRRSGK